MILLGACASRPVARTAGVHDVAEPLPPDIKPLTVEQAEQVAGMGGAG